jgi:hypothetical protein
MHESSTQIVVAMDMRMPVRVRMIVRVPAMVSIVS